MTQCAFRIATERIAVIGSAQRAGTGSANIGGMHVLKTFAETSQAVECAKPRRLSEIPVLFEAFGQAHGFFQTVDDGELAVAQLPDDHMETVGAQIDGRQNLLVLLCRDLGIDVAGLGSGIGYRTDP